MRGWLAVVLVIGIGSVAWAQETEEFEPDYLLNGAVGALWQPSLSDLNDALFESGYEALCGTVPFYGQSVTIGMVDGPRVGIFGITGETSSGIPGRNARLTLALGGFHVEVGKASDGSASSALGIGLGGGTATLTLVNHTPSSFDEALLVPSRTKLQSWLYWIEPFVAAHASPCDGLDLKLRAGYAFTVGCRWKAEGTALPTEMAPFAGPFFQIRIAADLAKLVQCPLLDEEPEIDGTALPDE